MKRTLVALMGAALLVTGCGENQDRQGTLTSRIRAILAVSVRPGGEVVEVWTGPSLKAVKEEVVIVDFRLEDRSIVGTVENTRRIQKVYMTSFGPEGTEHTADLAENADLRKGLASAFKRILKNSTSPFETQNAAIALRLLEDPTLTLADTQYVKWRKGILPPFEKLVAERPRRESPMEHQSVLEGKVQLRKVDVHEATLWSPPRPSKLETVGQEAE